MPTATSSSARPNVERPLPAEHVFRLDDGTNIFYRAWIPAESATRTLVLVHRGHEHSGRLEDVVDELDLSGVRVFAWDARGHGRSDGRRGDAPSFARVVKDLDLFVRHVHEAHGGRVEDTIVLGHSVGAVTVASWVHDYAPRVRAMVLVAPALRVKLYVPFAVPGLRAARAIAGARKLFVSSYVKGRMLTHDERWARDYDADPLVARAVSVDVLLGLHDASTRLLADAGALRLPTLVLASGADRVVRLDAQRRFFEGLGSADKEMRVYDGTYHDLLHEKDRAKVLGDVRAFVEERFARDDAPAPLLDADARGYTKDEYDRLRRPASPLGALSFGVQRAFLNTVGRLSRGVRLGWESGFDSGRSLDYVYENRARGALGLGRLVDRIYLDSPGWTGIRERKVNLERLLRDAIDRVRAGGERARVLDVATGCGRYVLEAIRDYPEGAVAALLRDNTPANVAAGKELAARTGARDVEFELGDAFDARALASVRPRPNVAIVSGLYELFPDNALVLRSLEGLAAAVDPGGYLVYTGQPWHPQLEMIARVLTNRDGEPWVMRRRTQAEIDDLVRAAGFEKVYTEVDANGIFSVSLARRVRA